MLESVKKKILIAEPSKKIEERIRQSSLMDDYTLFFVSDGLECQKQIESILPDLVVMELLLPKQHGIEILKWMKKNPALKSIGVIMTTYEIMQQNYRAAYDNGAQFFLEKPFHAHQLEKLIKQYFLKTLTKAPFLGPKLLEFGSDSYYNPKYETPKNYLRFWGTRGTSSVSGGEYTKFGGNTSCLEVRYGKECIIFDSGTGIRPLGEKLIAEGHYHLHLFISHTHQDHVVGFPFFLPLYFDRTQMSIYSPIGFEKTTKELFTDMLAYSFFPVRLEQMRAHVEFIDINDHDTLKIGQLEVSMCYTYHPGATLCFKIKTPKQTIAYVTDNEFLIGFHGHPQDLHQEDPRLDCYTAFIEFLQDCDLIIHEAQYFPKEYLERVGWGHSSMVNASILFKFAPCPIWIVTHHDPRHHDQDLNYKAELHRKILREANILTHIRYAYDGMLIEID